MPYWVIGSAYVAPLVSAAGFLGIVGLVYAKGMFGSAAYIGSIVGGVAGLALFLPLLMRFGQFTIPDFLSDRHDSNTVRALSAVILFIGYFVSIATQVIRFGILFQRHFGVPHNAGVAIAMAVVLIYTMLGGMLATAYEDVFQMIFMWTSTIIIAIIGVGVVFSGMPNLVGQLRESTPGYLTTAAAEGSVRTNWSVALIWLFVALILGVASATYLSFFPIVVLGAPWLVPLLTSIVITAVGMVVGSLVSRRPSDRALQVYESLKRVRSVPLRPDLRTGDQGATNITE